MSVRMRDLLEAGVHFGHQTRRWNPKMAPYLFGVKAGIHIIDLEKTSKALNIALAALEQFAAEGKDVLFISTKAQTKELVPELISPTGMGFMTARWPGGFMTNFQTMKKRIQFRSQLEKELTDEKARSRFTKKELLMKQRELDKLNILLAGAKNMTSVPAAVFVIDTLHDHIAMLEAQKLGLPIFALVDSNSDPDQVTFPIPANDDAVKSVRLILSLAAEAIKSGSTHREKELAAVASAPKTPQEALTIPEEALAEKGDADDAPSATRRRAPSKTSRAPRA